MKPELLRNIFRVTFIASTLVLVSFSGLAGTPNPATEPTHIPGIETPEVVGTAEPGVRKSANHLLQIWNAGNLRPSLKRAGWNLKN